MSENNKQPIITHDSMTPTRSEKTIINNSLTPTKSEKASVGSNSSNVTSQGKKNG